MPLTEWKEGRRSWQGDMSCNKIIAVGTRFIVPIVVE